MEWSLVESSNFSSFWHERSSLRRWKLIVWSQKTNSSDSSSFLYSFHGDLPSSRSLVFQIVSVFLVMLGSGECSSQVHEDIGWRHPEKLDDTLVNAIHEVAVSLRSSTVTAIWWTNWGIFNLYGWNWGGQTDWWPLEWHCTNRYQIFDGFLVRFTRHASPCGTPPRLNQVLALLKRSGFCGGWGKMPWSDAGSANANFMRLKMCVECWDKTSRDRERGSGGEDVWRW